MRFILSVLLTSVLAFLAGMFLPWWSIAIIAFLVAVLIPLGIGRGFLAGFLAIFLLWGLLALWIDIRNQGVMSGQMARLFSVGESGILLVLITAFVGALTGGFAAMTGSALRRPVRH